MNKANACPGRFQVVLEGLSKIDALIRLQKLDPVPARPEVQAAYRTAKAMLSALRLKLEVICSPGAEEGEQCLWLAGQMFACACASINYGGAGNKGKPQEHPLSCLCLQNHIPCVASVHPQTLAGMLPVLLLKAPGETCSMDPTL